MSSYTQVEKPKVSTKIPMALAKYQRLNRSVWYYNPEKSPVAPSETPSLIIFCGWMDATPRHISKYTAGYSAMYPHARILAITTTPWDMFPIDCISGGVPRIQPVLDILYGLQAHDKVLLHFMSNGGVMTSSFISKTFKEHTGRSLPIFATVMDSSPGKATWDASVKAFAVAVPKNPVVSALGYCLIYFLFGIYCGIFILFNMLDGVAQGRIDLNDSDIFETSAPRLYIYSEGDEIVDWNDVEEHASEAKNIGYQVLCEKFVNSSHASHLLSDPLRYWSSINRLWNMACTSSRYRNVV